ncbi:velvet factor [Lipomyces japonicus]|uniref:velvet factor n=1 Tax=Lipomyces japonicus TaxID=56871 RepID=UPI0034CFD078
MLLSHQSSSLTPVTDGTETSATAAPAQLAPPTNPHSVATFNSAIPSAAAPTDVANDQYNDVDDDDDDNQINDGHDPYIYSLEVGQQPVRARMCGFGDKDRRPVTPPPCIRLVVRHRRSMREVDVSNLDVSFFALTVELWSADCRHNLSLVSAVPGYMPVPIPASSWYSLSPSYSSVPASSFPSSSLSSSPSSSSASASASASASTSASISASASLSFSSSLLSSSSSSSTLSTTAKHYSNSPAGDGTAAPAPAQAVSDSNHAHNYSTPTFTSPPVKNLIGSVVATAFKLHDLQGRLGVWFVLQDLSVRTEGDFRLKVSFVNLGVPLPNVPASTLSNPFLTTTSSSSSSSSLPPSVPISPLSTMSQAEHQHQTHPFSLPLARRPVMVVNTGTAKVQASCFSDPFKVFITKKFPGVIETTALSRCFAMQGIKIPIRKEIKKNTNKKNINQK